MKTLFTTALLALFVSIQSFSQQECLPTRTVIYEGLQTWRATYEQLEQDSLIAPSISNVMRHFSYTSLLELYELVDNSNPGRTLVFKYYLDDKQTPQIALHNLEQETEYLIFENGVGLMVPGDYPALDGGFEKWEAFVNDRDLPFVCVYSYMYCWDNIFSRMSSNPEGQLYVENIAHTVSPFDTVYQLPANSTLEGFIAFDIVMSTDSPEIQSRTNVNRGRVPVSDFFDFAVPCPKNCRESIFESKAQVEATE